MNRCLCTGHRCDNDALPGRGYCASCIGGWHTAPCTPHTPERVNERLATVDIFALNLCGRCGSAMAVRQVAPSGVGGTDG